MSCTKYFQYLDKHSGRDPDHLFFYETLKKEIVEVNATNVIFYMLDVDIATHAISVFDWYMSNFKLKEMLPRGDWSALKLVSKRKRN